MKYWKEDKTDNGYGPVGLVLREHDNPELNSRVVSLCKSSNGNIEFMEECDGYFYVLLPEQQAIDALQEAIEWIKEALK